jgi:outer membrane protein assembly factor BamB
VISSRRVGPLAAVAALVGTLAATAVAQPAPKPGASVPPKAAAGPQAPLDRRLFPFLPLQAAWSNDLGASPSAASATDGTRVYVPTSAGELKVYALTTGALLASRPYATTLPLVMDDGRVIVTGDKIIDALKADDGSPLWQALLPAPAGVAPIVRGGWVFAALTNGAVTALRADTGRAVWSTMVGQPVAAPVVEGDRLYTAAGGGALQALSVTDGRAAWRITLDSDATAMAAVAGHVFVATSGRWLYDLDADRGRARWRFRLQGAAIGLAIDEGRVVAVTLDQAVRAFKIGSGAQDWRQELSFRPAGGPVIAGSSVLVTGFAPTVHAIDRKTGAKQGVYGIPLEADARGISLETLAAGPVLAVRATIFDDMLVLVTQHGLVHTARRLFDPPPSPLTALPGTPVTVPAPPPGMPAAAAPPATPAAAAPAPPPAATPPPATPGTPTHTPPTPPDR